MNLLRNFLALIGLISLILIGFIHSQYGSMVKNMGDMETEITAFKQLDPKAQETYLKLWQELKETGNIIDALVWEYPLKEGVLPEDAEIALQSVADKHHLALFGELKLPKEKEVENPIIAKYKKNRRMRIIKVFQYCEPKLAKQLLSYNSAYIANFPCRIALVEKKLGQYSLYTNNLDILLYGGKTLPEKLHNNLLKMKMVALDFLNHGSDGEIALPEESKIPPASQPNEKTSHNDT
ncbi:MAG TPA: DUF302 domain-containing protein [Thiothrix sp.]|nr:DUF302 domain-containing protein [Thiothrix sp.]